MRGKEKYEMNIEKINANGIEIAVVTSDIAVINDGASALDLIMTVNYEAGTKRIAVNKEALAEEFFVLSSGLLGEIAQKFVTYNVKFAVYGDYSGYTSKPLHDLMYEVNSGKDMFFTSTKEEAVEKLSKA